MGIKHSQHSTYKNKNQFNSHELTNKQKAKENILKNYEKQTMKLLN